ncbi:MAG: ribonuclease HI [Candidatus Marinimicrobia bacterium]|nr:ribonuclease HI [Candidatus Neomarinimicrobiota bacterium]MBL7023544.1 ribonuclease HI [Candidatus Neomarinimicrobiota bacterium]MBL7109568.1 ribonuclease HI [Candidatus Neomarinimicrobiota bacterium]
MDNNKTVEIFTDGACKGNPGPGGWGAILRYGNTTKELLGYSENTTNNIMELTAVIEALRSLTRTCKVVITTDSNYVKNGITKWIEKWKSNGWKTANRKSVKNQTLWVSLLEESKKHEISWHWVKGHSGHPENERADELANIAIEQNL